MSADNPMPDKKLAPEVPNHALESFARCILPGMQKYFESEEGQKEFAEWKGKQEKEQAAAEAAEPE